MAPGGMASGADLAGHDQFVAGREHHHARAARHRQAPGAHRGGQAQCLRRQTGAGAQHDRAALNVFAHGGESTWPDVHRRP